MLPWTAGAEAWHKGKGKNGSPKGKGGDEGKSKGKGKSEPDWVRALPSHTVLLPSLLPLRAGLTGQTPTLGRGIFPRFYLSASAARAQGPQ